MDVEELLLLVADFLRKKSFVELADELEHAIAYEELKENLPRISTEGSASETSSSGLSLSGSQVPIVSLMAQGARKTLSTNDLPSIAEGDDSGDLERSRSLTSSGHASGDHHKSPQDGPKSFFPRVVGNSSPSSALRGIPEAGEMAIYDMGPRSPVTPETPPPPPSLTQSSPANPLSASAVLRDASEARNSVSQRAQSPFSSLTSDNVRALSRHSRDSHSAHTSIKKPRALSQSEHHKSILNTSSLIKSLEKLSAASPVVAEHLSSSLPVSSHMPKSLDKLPSGRPEPQHHHRNKSDHQSSDDSAAHVVHHSRPIADQAHARSASSQSDSLPPAEQLRHKQKKHKSEKSGDKKALGSGVTQFTLEQEESTDSDVDSSDGELYSSTASTDRDSDDDEFLESYSEENSDEDSSTPSTPRSNADPAMVTKTSQSSKGTEGVTGAGSLPLSHNSTASNDVVHPLSRSDSHQISKNLSGEANSLHMSVPLPEEAYEEDTSFKDSVSLSNASSLPNVLIMPRYHNPFETVHEGDCNIVPGLDGHLTFFNLKIVHRVHHTGFEESRDFPIKIHDIVAGRYEVVEYLGSAAFSRAVQCLDRKTNTMVCMKIIKNNKDFFDQCLDEVKLLKYVQLKGDPDRYNVIKMFDFFYYKEHLFIVCELLKQNLYEFYKYNRESGEPKYFTLTNLKKVAKQCLIALDYIHSLGLIHCDLKPENILMKSYSRCEVKVIDLGSSCYVTDVMSSYVQSRSYRAPEVILGLPYGKLIDMWSLGCILAELYSGKVLFQNESVATLLARIVGIIGPIGKHLLLEGRYAAKYFTEDFKLFERDRQGGVEILQPQQTTLEQRIGCDDKQFIAFLRALLTVDPNERPTAAQALQHPWLAYDD